MAEKEIGNEEIPEAYQNLVRVIGWDAMLRLCQEYGGEVLYIPKLDRLTAAKQRELICKEWNGYNTVDLARKYNCSIRWIQKVVEGTRPPEIPGQMSMDDLT